MAETAAEAANADSLKENPEPEASSSVQFAQDPDTVEKGELEKRRFHQSFIRGGDKFEAEEDADGKRHHATPEDGYPLRETNLKLPFGGPTSRLVFNPFVSLFGLAFLWGLSIYCMAAPSEAQATLNGWFNDTIQYFTWFFISANPILTFFVIWLAFRYGHIKLGPKDEEPEFSDVSYFAMIFSSGVGVGLFFFGVSEPLWHQSSNYFTEAGYHSQNEIDQWALIITMYHWGFAAWSCYLTVALAAGLATYKFGLPMTIRATFYPIIGDYCWGWIGDLIDGFSIVMTVAGVCTSLGLGVIQIVSGLQRLGWIDPSKTSQEDLKNQYVAVIWIITLLATISVVSGLKVGIKTLSNVAFGLGTLILFLCFVMDKTYYLLNLLVQTTGMYLQWSIFQIAFWTDAFGSLNAGEGRAVDGNSAATWWIGAWTVFYLAWWVAWACFVGMFIARISRCRTLRTMIVSVLVIPTLYALFFMVFMGGIGLRQQRQALEMQVLGEEQFGNSSHYVNEEIGYCYNVPQEDVVSTTGDVVFTNSLPGVTPVCEFNSADSSMAWFNVMYSFSYPDGKFAGFGPFLSGFTIFTLALYFITSSDSGSLVVDILASNGRTEHHWIQRVFWAFTEGAVATALLVAGGSKALNALQAASIVFGLPFNLFLFVMCLSIVRMCRAIDKSDNLDEPHPDTLLPARAWEMPIFGGIFNIAEYVVSLGQVHTSRKEKGMDLPTKPQLFEFFKGLVFPFISLRQIYSSGIVDPKHQNARTNLFINVIYALCYFGWIALFVCGTINHGFVALGWALFFINACTLSNIRMHFRERLGIDGNIVGDFCACSFFYPQAFAQMILEIESAESPDDHEN